jgi:hypothetical protein
VTRDIDGDGVNDQTIVVTKDADGTTMTTSSELAAVGKTAVFVKKVTESADGLLVLTDTILARGDRH